MTRYWAHSDPTPPEQGAPPVDERIPACRNAGRGRRVVSGQHMTASSYRRQPPTEPIAFCPADCRGCQPCVHAHCEICNRAHLADLDASYTRTCPSCIGVVRGNIDTILELCTHMREQACLGANDGRLIAAAPIPGGAAMVLMGPAPRLSDWAARRTATEWAASTDVRAGHLPEAPIPTSSRELWPRPRIGEHLVDDDLDDPQPPLMTLAAAVDHWRTVRNEPTGLRPTLTRCADYLKQRLPWAAQQPFFPTFADAMAEVVADLEDVLYDGQRVDKTGISCIDCGGELVEKAERPKPCQHARHAREMAQLAYPDAAPWLLDAVAMRLQKWMLDYYPDKQAEHLVECDQGGYEGVSRTCRRCGRAYNPNSYALAVRARLEAMPSKKTRAAAS